MLTQGQCLNQEFSGRCDKRTRKTWTMFAGCGKDAPDDEQLMKASMNREYRVFDMAVTSWFAAEPRETGAVHS